MKKAKSISNELNNSLPEAQLLENNGNEQIAYDSVILPPLNMSVFGSKLSLKIIKELVREPACAMDISRSLGEHEQKIYYHLRRLEKAGIVKLKSKEKRYGMTAKIFGVVSPVIATKLYEHGFVIKDSRDFINPKLEKFLRPFLNNGVLDAKIVLGDPHPHGEYGATARDAVYLNDFTLFLGKFIRGPDVINCIADTEILPQDLKKNLILVGNPKINIIVNHINTKLPIYFDKKKEWTITSKLSGNVCTADNSAVILKTQNPYNKKNSILLLAGKRSQGLRSAVLAMIKYPDKIMEGNQYDKNVIAKVVVGMDKTGDGIIDSVKFIE